jgi:uncharacterized protein
MALHLTFLSSLGMAVVAVGAFLQGTTGFGFAMFAAPLLAVIDPTLVPGPILVLTLLMTVGVLLHDWREIDWPGLAWILLGRLPATVAAGWAIGLMARDTLSVVFALFVLGGVAVSLGRWRIVPNPASLVIAGGLSGFFGTLTSIGAPPLALVYQGQPGPTIRGTLSANIVVGVLVSIVALAWGGRFGAADAQRTLLLLPAGVVGLLLSRRALARIDGAALRPVLLGVTALSALLVLVRACLA